MSGLVSVIIPCFNSGKYLRECLDSVLSQTHKQIEVIVVDNNSTDDSYKIAQEISYKDERVIVLKEENPGASFARNKGLSFSNGNFIQFLDADDKLTPNKFEEQLKYFSDNIDIVVSDYGKYDDKFSILKELKTFENIENNPLETTITKIIITGNPLYSAEVVKSVGGYDVSLNSSQDWDFHLRLVLNNAKIKYCPGEFFKYRISDDSLSSNWVKVYKTACQIIIKHSYQIKNHPLFNDKIAKHISSIFYLTHIYSNDLNINYTIKNIEAWDAGNFSFIENKIKKIFVSLFGLKALMILQKRISFFR